MGVYVSWDNAEKTILRYTFENDWAWDEYLVCLQKGRQLTRGVRHPVCILNDASNTNVIPTRFVSLVQSVIQFSPPNTGLAIILTSDRYFKVLYRVLAHVLPQVTAEYHLVKTEEAAYQHLYDWMDNQVEGEAQTVW